MRYFPINLCIMIMNKECFKSVLRGLYSVLYVNKLYLYFLIFSLTFVNEKSQQN
jgi:hypothetical protein